MLFVELVTNYFNNHETINNKNSIAYSINPITDINILKQELKELQQANKDIAILNNKDINYLSLFNMQLNYFNQLHDNYKKTEVIINNNEFIIINNEFKHHANLIKQELKKLIHKLKQLQEV